MKLSKKKKIIRENSEEGEVIHKNHIKRIIKDKTFNKEFKKIKGIFLNK